MRRDYLWIALLLLLLEVGWLLHDLDVIHFKTAAIDSSQSLGTISLKTAEVRRRSQDKLYWEDIDKSDSVFAYDSVMTQEKSQAEVTLKNGVSLLLDENTLIVIQPTNNPNDPFSVLLKFGGAHVVRGSALAVKIINQVKAVAPTPTPAPVAMATPIPEKAEAKPVV